MLWYDFTYKPYLTLPAYRPTRSEQFLYPVFETAWGLCCTVCYVRKFPTFEKTAIMWHLSFLTIETENDTTIHSNV